MNWIYLFLAGIFEIGWTIGLKQMDNHKNLLWTAIFYISIITSFYFLQLALKVIPIGTAYAIYTSIGAVGTVILIFRCNCATCFGDVVPQKKG